MNVSMHNDRIVILGHTGMVGCNLFKRLAQLRFSTVFGVSKSTGVDFRQWSQINNYLKHKEATVVINVAGTVGGIGANRKSPGTFFYDNMLMNMNIIDVCARRNIKLVQLGTTCSYPRVPVNIPFKETDLFTGLPEETNAPYGIAKLSLLSMMQAYSQEFDLKGIYLIPTNMYGPFDHFKDKGAHVIPMLIDKIAYAKKYNKPLEVWGTGKATRDFVYVEDAVNAIILAMLHYNSTKPVNIGSGQETSIEMLVNMLCGIVNFTGEIVWKRDMPDGQPRRCLDITRIAKLGWVPETPLKDGLIKTYQWYKENVQ